MSLQAQLSHAELLKQITETQGFQELVKIMQAEANRRRKGRDAIHWDSTADEFQAYEKKSLYAAGFIQGVEFGVNVLEALPQQYSSLKQQIEDLAKQIKDSKKRDR